MTQKYHDEEWLREQYIENRRSMNDIAEECNVHNTTILSWLNKNDIETRDKHCPRSDERLRDREWLEKKYWDEGLSTTEIAEICDATDPTVRRWMERNNVDRRKPPNERHPDHQLRNTSGYEVVQNQYNGSGNVVLVHRLIAVAECGFEEVVDKVVHHKNEHKIDNRPSNLQVVSPAEHNRIHHSHE